MLDREYSTNSSTILEFIQRYVFKINPVDGNKGKSLQKRKIFALIEKIYQKHQIENEFRNSTTSNSASESNSATTSKAPSSKAAAARSKASSSKAAAAKTSR